MTLKEAKPLLKRLSIAAIIFPPIMAFSRHEDAKRALVVKPSLAASTVRQALPSGKDKHQQGLLLLDDRCVGVKTPTP